MMKKSCDNDDGYPPYKVSYPGKYDPYHLTPSSTKDPRLGTAQKRMERFYEKHGFKDDDDDDDDVDESSQLPHRVVRTPYENTSNLPLKRYRIPFNGIPADSSYEDEIERENNANLPFRRYIIPLSGFPADLPYEDVTEPESTKLALRSIPYNIAFLPFNSEPCISAAECAKAHERSLKNQLKRAVKHEATYLKEIDCKCAEAAIKFYNQKHGTDYKIVETLGSYRRFYTSLWFHCNFRAQCCESDPSLPKLFFAELNRIDHDNLIVKDCVPLDDGLVIRTPIVGGCEMCGKQLWHPVNGFQVGQFGGSS